MMLIDIVSRGGNLLLDIGPTADGRIPTIMEDRLLHIGKWLGVNGEAIYGTRAWKRSRQWGPGAVPKLEQKEYMGEYEITRLVDAPPAGTARVEAFLTAKGDTVYAIVPRRPTGALTIDGIERFQTVTLAGRKLNAAMIDKKLVIQVPDAMTARLPASDAWVFQIAGVAQ
jgi:alpha-L-fucosidase